jgi:hypothetical protein
MSQQPQSSPPGPGPTGQPSSKAVISLLVGLGIAAALVGIGGVVRASLGSSGGAVAHTVTYATSGPADVTYGPAGSSLTSSVPVSETDQIGSAAYYYIQAQADPGPASCSISVDGQVISRAIADDSGGIAQCEIVPDGSGGWRSATG